MSTARDIPQDFYPAVNARANRSDDRDSRTTTSQRVFRSGDVVPQSGIYQLSHPRSHQAEHDVMLVKGDRFPECQYCGNGVTFSLLRSRPYIFEDGDFQP